MTPVSIDPSTNYMSESSMREYENVMDALESGVPIIARFEKVT
jgi:hypothetical protein